MEQTETAFDLAQLRKARRLLRHGLAELDKIERHITRMAAAPRQRKPTAAELEAVRELYEGPEPRA